MLLEHTTTHISSLMIAMAISPLLHLLTRVASETLLYDTEFSYKQIACAPPGTQACTFDIAKFHRTCPVIPAHKPWLVVQGTPGQFYVDHVHPFGSVAASSNAGMIGNAIVDIWQAEGIRPTLKYEDDLKIFRCPTSTSTDDSYVYDRE